MTPQNGKQLGKIASKSGNGTSQNGKHSSNNVGVVVVGWFSVVVELFALIGTHRGKQVGRAPTVSELFDPSTIGTLQNGKQGLKISLRSSTFNSPNLASTPQNGKQSSKTIVTPEPSKFSLEIEAPVELATAPQFDTIVVNSELDQALRDAYDLVAKFIKD